MNRWEASSLASAVDVDTVEELERCDPAGRDPDASPRGPLSADDCGVCAGDVPPLIGQVLTGPA